MHIPNLSHFKLWYLLHALLGSHLHISLLGRLCLDWRRSWGLQQYDDTPQAPQPVPLGCWKRKGQPGQQSVQHLLQEVQGVSALNEESGYRKKQEDLL